MNFTSLILLLSLIFSHVAAEPGNLNSWQVAMSTDKDVRIPDLAGQMPAPILLERLTYESDVALEPDEFNYLVGLEEDTLITADQLQKAVYHLRQKNKFATIEISARPGERG